MYSLHIGLYVSLFFTELPPRVLKLCRDTYIVIASIVIILCYYTY